MNGKSQSLDLGKKSPTFAIAAPLPREVDVSFELFPPNSPPTEQSFWACLTRLAPLDPRFVSITHGAGGSTCGRSLHTVTRIRHNTKLEPAAHLTCVGADRGRVDIVAHKLWNHGIRHIVALRGDPPRADDRYEPHPDGYAYASDLIEGLKRIADFRISIAAYPEMHPESRDIQDDLDNLKRKVDAGATQAITQYFFDVDVFLRYLERVRAASITIPIIPGIMPVTNFKQVVKFSAMCGASVPTWLADLFDGLEDDAETRCLVAASVAAEQCRVLHANGINQFHFYTMNRAELCMAICHMLGKRAKPMPA